MKQDFKTSVKVKRNRLKRNSGKIFREILSSCVLLGAVAMVASVLILYYNFLLSSNFFQVEKINVKGCERLTEKDVIGIADIQPSQNLLALRTEVVTDNLKRNPWIKEVSVTREFPRSLSIEIQEKKAIALAKKSNDLFFIDAEGAVIKKIESSEESDLPVLTGFAENAELVRKSIELLTFFAAQPEFPQAKDIAEINGDEVNGLSIFLENGLCLQLGIDEYASKLRKFKMIMADLSRRNMATGYLLIDLHNPGSVTVNKRNMLPVETRHKKYST